MSFNLCTAPLHQSDFVFIWLCVHLTLCSSDFVFIWLCVHLTLCSSDLCSSDFVFIWLCVHLTLCSSDFVFIWICVHLTLCSSDFVFIWLCVHLTLCSSDFVFIWLCVHLTLCRWVMTDRDGLLERVMGICAISITWWWWWYIRTCTFLSLIKVLHLHKWMEIDNGHNVLLRSNSNRLFPCHLFFSFFYLMNNNFTK